jgi:phytoene synthase
MDGTPSIAASYEHCRRLTRAAGSSFYYPLWLMPRRKRRAMYAFYAFCRVADDLGDGPAAMTVKRAQLDDYRGALRGALAGEASSGEFPALVDAVERFQIPHETLFAILDGVGMDLAPRRYANWGELQTYCYHVAGAVGLACLAIWGGDVPEAHHAAIRCGEAFQLTNILRDVREDAIPPDCRAVFAAMWRTYRALLREIERREGDVFSRRVRLSRAARLWIVATGWRGGLVRAGAHP